MMRFFMDSNKLTLGKNRLMFKKAPSISQTV